MVISIIAVLAGLLLPVVSKVTENARKVSAKSTETQIVSAVNSFQTDYGQYPGRRRWGRELLPRIRRMASTVHNYTLFQRAPCDGNASGGAARR